MYQNLWPDELKILVVDDEQETLNLIRLSLEPAGFRVLRTSKPEEGLDLALREQPDLLVLDVMMPGIDGFELLRRVRRHPKLEKVPVIIISAQVGSAVQQRIMQLCQPSEEMVDAYLSKPFDPAHLLQTVKDVIVKYRQYLLEKNRIPEKPWEKQNLVF